MRETAQVRTQAPRNGVPGLDLATEFGIRDPQVGTGLREPVPAAQVLHREACLGLPQEPDDLRFRKSLLHVRSPFPDDRTLNRSATQNGGDVGSAQHLRRLAAYVIQSPSDSQPNRCSKQGHRRLRLVSNATMLTVVQCH